jgi:hypothetical protein
MSDAAEKKQRALALYQKRVREHKTLEAKVKACTSNSKCKPIFFGVLYLSTAPALHHLRRENVLTQLSNRYLRVLLAETSENGPETAQR